uniref:Uncharacterized protein n=1 Tax=Physcomitrium patens TaxID=3218 RepID=A0A7I4A144_PHYPA
MFSMLPSWQLHHNKPCLDWIGQVWSRVCNKKHLWAWTQKNKIQKPVTIIPQNTRTPFPAPAAHKMQITYFWILELNNNILQSHSANSSLCKHCPVWVCSEIGAGTHRGSDWTDTPMITVTSSST